MNIFKSKWGKWEVITLGKVNEHFYLLQARQHENGKVQFRVERSDSVYGGQIPTTEEFKDMLDKD